MIIAHILGTTLTWCLKASINDLSSVECLSYSLSPLRSEYLLGRRSLHPGLSVANGMRQRCNSLLVYCVYTRNRTAATKPPATGQSLWRRRASKTRCGGDKTGASSSSPIVATTPDFLLSPWNRLRFFLANPAIVFMRATKILYKLSNAFLCIRIIFIVPYLCYVITINYDIIRYSRLPGTQRIFRSLRL